VAIRRASMAAEALIACQGHDYTDGYDFRVEHAHMLDVVNELKSVHQSFDGRAEMNRAFLHWLRSLMSTLRAFTGGTMVRHVADVVNTLWERAGKQPIDSHTLGRAFRRSRSRNKLQRISAFAAVFAKEPGPFLSNGYPVSLFDLTRQFKATRSWHPYPLKEDPQFYRDLNPSWTSSS
jgi:hypothetical protein